MDASSSDSKFATTLVAEATAEPGSTFVTALEEEIERSKSHWSELEEPTELLSKEEAAAMKLDNEEVFMVWRSHPEWGHFFRRWDDFLELKVGNKFAEGAQAELFEVDVQWRDATVTKWNAVLGGGEWVVKVFKEGTSIRGLQRQWPHGMLQYRAMRRKLGKRGLKRHISAVVCAILLEDGRFAFLIEKEKEDLRKIIERQMLEIGDGGEGPFSREVAEEYMYGVAFGVDELHRFNIVHRDVKASNVLVYKSQSTHIFVSDYECSIGVIGTGWWRAPEILQACKEGNVNKKPELFSKAVDIYSLGMTFYEILTGNSPFQDEEVTRDGVIEGQRPYVPEFVDEWARQLLHRCWEPNCDARPTIEDILGILEANSTFELIKEMCTRRAEHLREVETLVTAHE